METLRAFFSFYGRLNRKEYVLVLLLPLGLFFCGRKLRFSRHWIGGRGRIAAVCAVCHDLVSS